MARIRTIKPEFFTSEDIVSLSPLARLLYIAVWCEADKEGRLVWRPRTFKLRYLPADSCDVEALCGELVAAGLVVLYGDGLAYIPKFSRHQHINPRESASTLPDPGEKARVTDASARVSDAQVGREGEGREGENTHTPLAPEWVLPKAWGEWAIAEYPHWTPEAVRSIAEQFADHQWAKAATSAEWSSTWRKWCRDDLTQRAHPVPKPKAADKPVQGAPAITVPSTDKGAERFQAAMDERAATATKPPAAVLALAGKAVRTA